MSYWQERKEDKQRRDADRNAAVRSPKDQLKELDKRLGVGVGAKKERARLDNKINT